MSKNVKIFSIINNFTISFFLQIVLKKEENMLSLNLDFTFVSFLLVICNNIDWKQHSNIIMAHFSNKEIVSF